MSHSNIVCTFLITATWIFSVSMVVFVFHFIHRQIERNVPNSYYNLTLRLNSMGFGQLLFTVHISIYGSREDTWGGVQLLPETNTLFWNLKTTWPASVNRQIHTFALYIINTLKDYEYFIRCIGCCCSISRLRCLTHVLRFVVRPNGIRYYLMKWFYLYSILHNNTQISLSYQTG